MEKRYGDEDKLKAKEVTLRLFQVVSDKIAGQERGKLAGQRKRGYDFYRNPLKFLVELRRIELLTS